MALIQPLLAGGIAKKEPKKIEVKKVEEKKVEVKKVEKVVEKKVVEKKVEKKKVEKVFELNDKEQKVFEALKKAGAKGIHLRDMAKACWPTLGSDAKMKGNSWCRNSLRGLLANKLAKQIGRGTYAVTGKKISEC